MQVSMNADDANVRPRRQDRRCDVVEGGAMDPKRQSIRLIDLNQELPARVDYPHNPPVRFIKDPFSPPSLEGLPQALLDQNRDLQPQDPFDVSHLQPPQQQFVCSKASNNAASQSTPSLPIAVASRPSASDPNQPSDISNCSGLTSMSSASIRLSSSADSALAALPPPPPPPGRRLANSDEVDACGCHDHPDLPPRAAFPGGNRPRIMPIFENGQRTSYTHYWVIPPRVPRSRHSGSPSRLPAADTEHYVNVKNPPSLVHRSASMPPRTQPRERRYVKRPCGDPDSDVLGCATNRAFVDDVVDIATCGAMADFDVVGLDSSAMVASSVESDSSWEAQQQQQRSVPSAEECKARILAVRDAVHGVTDEEAQMFLQTHRWEVDRSIRLLKVEQLFRLGVTPSKSECKRILDDAGGDLELASGRLIG